MNIELFKKAVASLFGDLLKQYVVGDEYALYEYGPQTVGRIGYATNITPEIVEQAAAQKVDMIISHHDAWDFVFGMKEECHSLLKRYGINHYFIHAPLDYADFGTCHSLFKALGINKIIRQSTEHDNRSIPGIGELEDPLTFEELVDKVRLVLDEDVKSWKNLDNRIKRVGIITGAGNSNLSIRDALHAGCDVYITGEKTLYTIQYAKFAGINLIVGSHTFTEIFGVRALCDLLKEKFGDLEILQLQEEHLE